MLPDQEKILLHPSTAISEDREEGNWTLIPLRRSETPRSFDEEGNDHHRRSPQKGDVPCSQKARNKKGAGRNNWIKGGASKAEKCFSQWWGLKFTINILSSFNAVLWSRLRIVSKPFTLCQENTKTSESTLLPVFNFILFPSSSSCVTAVLSSTVSVSCRWCPSTKRGREKSI